MDKADRDEPFSLDGMGTEYRELKKTRMQEEEKEREKQEEVENKKRKF